MAENWPTAETSFASSPDDHQRLVHRPCLKWLVDVAAAEVSVLAWFDSEMEMEDDWRAWVL
jgi:hypothetical protein